MDCKCNLCGTLVDEANLGELLGTELQKIRETQFKSQIEGTQVVECPNASCKSVFLFEQSKVNYVAKDDEGNTVTRETAEHMAKYRVRCSACTENFCVNCKMSPYHINLSCEDAKNKKIALKCRFCWDVMREQSISQERAFQDVCRKPECIKMMQESCSKVHPCGHACKGFAKEAVCLPCLEPDCID